MAGSRLPWNAAKNDDSSFYVGYKGSRGARVAQRREEF
jgi:hypothetical protein